VSDRAALFRAILDNPDDDTSRLAYADWLDEHADEFPESEREAVRGRAAYIRAQIALARLPVVSRPSSLWSAAFSWGGGVTSWTVPPDDFLLFGGPHFAERNRLLDEINGLAERFAPAWNAELPGDWPEAKPYRRRGFVEDLKISPRLLLTDPARYLDAAPIRELILEWNHRHGPNRAEDAPAVAALPQLARVRELGVHPAGAEFVTNFVRAFVVSPAAAGLRKLYLSQTDIGEDALIALAGSDHLAELRTLNLSRNRLTPDGLAALATSSKLAGLRHLLLNRCGLNPDGVEQLCRDRLLEQLEGLDIADNPQFGEEGTRRLTTNPNLARFRALGLSGNRIGTTGCRVIATSRYTAAVEELVVSHCEIGGAGVGELLTSAVLSRLHTLGLRHNPIDAAAVEAFAGITPTIPLRRLDLGYCHTGDAGVVALARSLAVRQLTHLRLNHDDIGDAGAVALAGCSHLTGLRELDLSGNRITDAGAEALARSQFLAGLVRLRISENQLTDRGALALAELPGLKPFGLSAGGTNVSDKTRKKIDKLLEARRKPG
jgi:uncharacterized protein (TIGR02996 family)